MTDNGQPPAPAGDPEPGPRPDRDLLPVLAPDGDGLRWSFELDLVSVLEELGRPLRDWDGVDQEEDLAAELAAYDLLDAPPGPEDIPPPASGPAGSAGAA
jgi:hypothetical protein